MAGILDRHRMLSSKYVGHFSVTYVNAWIGPHEIER